MSKVSTLIKYICSVYPHAHELSNARLTKLIYLVDWEFVQNYGHQLTDIHWYFDNYGPFVRDIQDIAYEDPEIEILNTQTIYGTAKTLFRYTGSTPSLEPEIRNILNNVIENTKNLYWNDFIKYVYSTPPIVQSDRYTNLNLITFRTT